MHVVGTVLQVCLTLLIPTADSNASKVYLQSWVRTARDGASKASPMQMLLYLDWC